MDFSSRESQTSAPKNVGKLFSYSLSLWEWARVRARSVAKKEKQEWGWILGSLIPHPNPLPKGGRLEDSDATLATDDFLAH